MGRVRPVAPLMAVIVMVAAPALLARPGHTAQMTQAETAAPPAGRQMATFAAGCFWSMQAIFQQLKGVERVEPGYAGGTEPHPSYDAVETGSTGYAETINITFDPKIISYQTLLHVLLTVRNPTTLNQQGPDTGTNYRSVIFSRNPAQQAQAESAIRQVAASHVWRGPIVTTVQPLTTFWRAEDYHFDYYRKHPDEPYCVMVIAPEIAAFRAKYPQLLKPS